MFDIKFILENKDLFVENLIKRKFQVTPEMFNADSSSQDELSCHIAQSDSNPIASDMSIDYLFEQLSALYEQKKTYQIQLEYHQQQKNILVGQYAKIKQNSSNLTNSSEIVHSDDLVQESNKIQNDIDSAKSLLDFYEKKCDTIVSFMPNLLDSSVYNVVNEYMILDDSEYIPNRPLDNTVSHDELGKNLGMIDSEVATKMSGRRFVVLRSDLSQLERALSNFMLDHHISSGYVEYSVPLLVHGDAMFGTGQLPKFSNGFRFHWPTNDVNKKSKANRYDDYMYLIPTSEVSLVNCVRDSILDESMLPMKLVSCTPCFRSESGSGGQDTKGLIRQHQFLKVELVQITMPSQSNQAHEEMLESIKSIMRALDLRHRVILLRADDTGFASQKTYDVETWFPSQNMYREISSCSNTGEFQARRMRTRVSLSNKKKCFVHTLNGSGVAIGRAMAAIMEQYQNTNGDISIPECLWKYMGGKKIITASKNTGSFLKG